MCESDIQRVQTNSEFTKQDLGLLSMHTISTHNDLPFHGIGNTTLEDLFMNEPAVMDNTDLIDSQDRDFASFVDARAKYNSNFLIAHLNINSLQNKFE